MESAATGADTSRHGTGGRARDAGQRTTGTCRIAAAGRTAPGRLWDNVLGQLAVPKRGPRSLRSDSRAVRRRGEGRGTEVWQDARLSTRDPLSATK